MSNISGVEILNLMQLREFDIKFAIYSVLLLSNIDLLEDVDFFSKISIIIARDKDKFIYTISFLDKFPFFLLDSIIEYLSMLEGIGFAKMISNYEELELDRTIIIILNAVEKLDFTFS